MATQLENVFAADERSALNAEAKRIFSELIQLDQYVGDVYSISYETALVQIHDNHRQKVGGIPSLSFLIATRVDPEQPVDYKIEDSSIILLRVMDAAPLPKFRPGGLLVAHAGGDAGMFSAVIGGWVGGTAGSTPVTIAI